MNKLQKNLALWLVIAIITILAFNLINRPPTSEKELPYSEFLDLVENGKVSSALISPDQIEGKLISGDKFTTFAPDDNELIGLLRQHNVEIKVKPTEKTTWWMSLLINWFPMLLLIGVWIFFMRQMQGTGNKAMTFGKSRAKLHTETKDRVTFADVEGADEPKEELQEIIEFLKNPGKFQRLGGRIPKGVLLFGPPGSGKTLLARAVAGEANVPFFSISGSDFVEMFVGVGASRVRDLFSQGKKNAPCIIFIDEIDAVGRQRFAGLGGGHDEREQTLNQLLVEMDGFAPNETVILMAATNRPDVLDPALLRPGRFDRQIVVDRPDQKGREGILKVHARKIKMADDNDIQIIARRTPGFSGADLANLINEAALLAARRNKDVVGMDELEESIDRVMAGPERKSRVIGDREKEIIAYHESGHALVAKLIPGTDPVHKVSIIPRGHAALGYTLQLPTEDRYIVSKTEIMNKMAIMMGGRVAEDLIFGEITTGAQNDLEKATEAAHRMVCKFGMSEKLGPLTFGHEDQQVFMGRDIVKGKGYSERTATDIDDEIHSLVMGCYNRAKTLITDNKDKLIKLATLLLENEVLEGSEVEQVLNGVPQTA